MRTFEENLHVLPPMQCHEPFSASFPLGIGCLAVGDHPFAKLSIPFSRSMFTLVMRLILNREPSSASEGNGRSCGLNGLDTPGGVERVDRPKNLAYYALARYGGNLPEVSGSLKSTHELYAVTHGSVPEWLKGTGCKPVGSAYLGSNPSAPTICLCSSVGRALRW